ncbi:hypothetical protein [Thiomonas intermedia]|uniref:hypothetical protein n=1 Tax=Thiomonas intermedia TaxID=926 RepID=UPI001C54DB6C|nr:hypothetical protein [Thiomonas intermedia]
MELIKGVAETALATQLLDRQTGFAESGVGLVCPFLDHGPYTVMPSGGPIHQALHARKLPADEHPFALHNAIHVSVSCG